jgi:hypothetical protein
MFGIGRKSGPEKGFGNDDENDGFERTSYRGSDSEIADTEMFLRENKEDMDRAVSETERKGAEERAARLLKLLAELKQARAERGSVRSEDAQDDLKKAA